MDGIIGNDNQQVDVMTLETPNLASMLSSSASATGELPSTAEIIQKCIAVNPFELKFREANRRISQCSEEMLEQNGLVPTSLPLSTTGGLTFLKLPSSLPHSPSFFSNISVLSAAENDANARTPDFSRLMQQLSRCNEEYNQAPRTADVLNAVLDMHSDRYGTVGYASLALSTPANSEGSQKILPIVSSISNALSNTPLSAPSTSANAEQFSSLIFGSPSSSSTSPNSLTSFIHTTNNAILNTSSLTPQSVLSLSERSASPQPPNLKKRLSMRAGAPPIGNVHVLTSIGQLNQTATSTNIDEANNVTPLRNASNILHAGEKWDPRDVKPVILPKNEQTQDISNQTYFDHEDVAYQQHQQSIQSKSEELIVSGPRSNESETSSNTTQIRSGRGRGRASTTADLPPDERRVTILERNKAAAVRYRKRKKEEHDEMVSRVHMLEQDKVALSTQNQVLRRELERMSALLKAQEARCVCRLGAVSDAGRSDSPVEVDNLSNRNHAQQQPPTSSYLRQTTVSALHAKKAHK